MWLHGSQKTKNGCRRGSLLVLHNLCFVSSNMSGGALRHSYVYFGETLTMEHALKLSGGAQHITNLALADVKGDKGMGKVVEVMMQAGKDSKKVCVCRLEPRRVDQVSFVPVWLQRRPVQPRRAACFPLSPQWRPRAFPSNARMARRGLDCHPLPHNRSS